MSTSRLPLAFAASPSTSAAAPFASKARSFRPNRLRSRSKPKTALALHATSIFGAVPCTRPERSTVPGRSRAMRTDLEIEIAHRVARVRLLVAIHHGCVHERDRIDGEVPSRARRGSTLLRCRRCSGRAERSSTFQSAVGVAHEVGLQTRTCNSSMRTCLSSSGSSPSDSRSCFTDAKIASESGLAQRRLADGDADGEETA